MNKYITLAALFAAGTVCANAGSTTANLGNGFTGTWTEYNLPGITTTGTNSIKFTGEHWGGATSWITLTEKLTLSTTDILTFSYSYSYGRNNGIYSISFLGNGGDAAFAIGNLDYGNQTLGAVSTTRGTTGFYQALAQSIRFNPGNSNDRIQAVNKENDATTDIGVSGEGFVSAVVAYNTEKTSYELTLSAGGKETSLLLGSSVSFDTISFSRDANADQTISGMSMTLTSVPEPSAFGLLAGIGAIALVASRRRRK